VKALKWAFVPGTTTTGAWSSFKSGVETKPPFSIIIGGIGWLTDVVTGAGEHGGPTSGVGTTGGDQFGCVSGAAWGPTDIMNGNDWCISTVADEIHGQNVVFFNGLRNLLRIGLYVMVGFSMWTRLGHFVGMPDAKAPVPFDAGGGA
jgi:hypothetical protein